MEKYIVGGYVRDKLIGVENKDIDYVVIGETPLSMLNMGFEQVGKDFPVFLHPETKDEYALARKEKVKNKNNGFSYGNFSFETDNISLKDDLLRRDLTINSMAMDIKTNKIIDYFGGLNDIKNKLLKHTSIAFVEDPIRILRTCRFAARYKKFGFKIHSKTLDLMKVMVESNMLDNVSSERILLEFKKGLMEDDAQVMIEELRNCGALKKILPEVDVLFGIEQRADYHPEIDTGVHTLMVLKKACEANLSFKERYSCLLHDVGKGLTKKELLPSHLDHDIMGVPLVENINKRLGIDKKTAKLAMLVCNLHQIVHNINKMRPNKIIQFFNKVDAYRTDNLICLLNCCKADSMGRKGFEQTKYPQLDYTMEIFNEIKKIDLSKIANECIEKNQKHLIEERIYNTRLNHLKSINNELISKYINNNDEKEKIATTNRLKMK